jgi:Protein of unknown function (DUF3422)
MPGLSTAAGYSARLHRRPAYAVNSPAILCHRCYSFKDEGAAGDAAAYIQARRKRTAALNKILGDIQRAHRPATERYPIQVFKEEEAAVSGHDQNIEYVGRQETILASLHVLDQNSEDWAGWRARMRVDIHIEYYSVTFILDRVDLKTTLKRSPEKPPSGEKESRAFVSQWYRKIWDEFFKLVESKGVALDFPTDGRFFECRGLVIDTAAPAAPVASRPRFPILDDRIFAMDRRESKDALKSWIDTNGDVMSRILRLDRSKGEDQDANCVLCHVMNGRGVYASSMGRSEAELRASSGPTDATPERYLLLHHGLPRFQVGRMLRRFHILDELRCASAFNFNELIAASRSIRALGDYIDNRLRGSTQGLSRKSLKDIQRELNTLTSNQRIGGLLYRINRSRFYARGFKLGLGDLRIAPIKGWEPYDAFMHRSLFPTIDHIDGIGQRFEALSSRVERLTEERDVAESINVQNRIADIQQIGEIIGWTAFAYYGGQILDKFLPAGPESCALCSVVDLCHIVHHHIGTVISALFAFAAYLHFRNHKREHD